ncbi:MAG: Bcr/CflA family drug resistance efflux transporter, partial [Pseudomonadota bacterium]
EHYGLTPRQYSLAFAVNAASFIGVSQFAGKLAERYGLPRIVSLAVLGFLDLVVPTTSVMALDDHGEIAGAASALMGTLQLVLGAVVIAVMGLFVDGTARPMVAGIAVVAVIAWVLARWTLGGRPRETAPA